MHKAALLSTIALVFAGVLTPRSAIARSSQTAMGIGTAAVSQSTSAVRPAVLAYPATPAPSRTQLKAPAAHTAAMCSPAIVVTGAPPLATAAQLAPMQAVLQLYATTVVAPIWPNCDIITLNLVDYPDPFSGSLAWHTFEHHQVVAYLDVLDGGLDYQLASHEIAEAIADPRPMTFIPTNYSGPCGTCAGKSYQGQLRFEREIADPVEDLSHAVTGPDGHIYQLSDFVLPSFYQPNGVAPYDWAGLVHRPQQPTMSLAFLDTTGREQYISGAGARN